MLTIPKPLPVKQMNKLNAAELQIPHFSEGNVCCLNREFKLAERSKNLALLYKKLA